jgi:threonine/homoserine/homoserine lactone efflux protein
MILALILGAVIGFLTNAPVGPINAAVMTHGLSERFSRGMAIGVGAALMDFIYCMAAMFGISFLSDEPVINMLFQAAGFVVLIIFGIKTLMIKRDYTEIQSVQSKAEEKALKVEQRIYKAEEKVHLKMKLQGPFFLGVLIYLANPSFLPYWLGVSGILQKYHLLVPTQTNNLLFALGVGVGSAGWFYLILHLLLSGKITLKPTVINGIYKFSGVALLGFGAYAGYRMLLFTDWTNIFHILSNVF